MPTRGGSVVPPTGAILVGNLTLGASYELVSPGGLSIPAGTALSVLRLSSRRNFPTAVADAKTNPPTGWAWANNANIDSGVIASNTLSVVRGTGIMDGFNAGDTPPLLYKTRLFSDLDLAMRLRHPEAAARWVSVIIKGDTDNMGGTYLRAALGTATSAIYIARNAGNGNSASLTTQQMTVDGVWVRLRLTRDGIVTAYYSVSTSTTRPTTWTWIESFQVFTATSVIGRNIRYGLHWVNTSGAAAVTTDVYAVDDSVAPSDLLDGGVVGGGGQGYDSTGPAQIVGDWDLGSASAVLTTAEIRARIAERVNIFPGDAATWTFSFTRGASATPAEATTYQSAAALDIKTGGTDTITTTGRYATLRAKATSSGGTQSGSLDLGGLGFSVL